MSPLKSACNPNRNDSAALACLLNAAAPSTRRPNIESAKEKQVTRFKSSLTLEELVGSLLKSMKTIFHFKIK